MACLSLRPSTLGAKTELFGEAALELTMRCITRMSFTLNRFSHSEQGGMSLCWVSLPICVTL